jgi:hypothetical protein
MLQPAENKEKATLASSPFVPSELIVHASLVKSELNVGAGAFPPGAVTQYRPAIQLVKPKRRSKASMLRRIQLSPLTANVTTM